MLELPILQGAFDWVVLLAIVLYLFWWAAYQKKPTNKQFLGFLAASFAFLLIIDVASLISSDYLILLAVVPSLMKPAKEGAIKLLNYFCPQLKGCTKCMSFRNCWCKATSILPPATISNRLP